MTLVRLAISSEYMRLILDLDHVDGQVSAVGETKEPINSDGWIVLWVDTPQAPDGTQSMAPILCSRDDFSGTSKMLSPGWSTVDGPKNDDNSEWRDNG